MAAEEDELTIGEAARFAGVPPSTLRYWETAGLLKPPRRIGGKRRYDNESLQQIEMVALAKRAGFSLAEIRIILAGLSDKTPPSEIWRRLATAKLPEVEATLAEAQVMKGVLEAGLRCECLSLADCLAHASCPPGLTELPSRFLGQEARVPGATNAEASGRPRN